MAVVFQTAIVIGLLGTAISSARPEEGGLASASLGAAVTGAALAAVLLRTRGPWQ